MAEESHPLQHTWVLWEHKAATSKDPSKWKENMKQLCTVSTVEEFWQNFSHIPKPSEVFFDGQTKKMVGPEKKTIEEYSLFKKGIEPEWTDPKNVTGGEWLCRQYFEPEILDLFWQNLALALIGETIEDAIDGGKGVENCVNGARVLDKSRNMPLYRLEIWVSTRDPTVKEKIRTKLEEIMVDGQPPSSRKAHPKFEWKDHNP